MDVGRGEPKNNGIVKPIVGGAEPPVSSKNSNVPGQWFPPGCAKFRAFDIFRLVGTSAPLAPGKDVGTGGALNVRRLLGNKLLGALPGDCGQLISVWGR